MGLRSIQDEQMLLDQKVVVPAVLGDWYDDEEPEDNDEFDTGHWIHTNYDDERD